MAGDDLPWMKFYPSDFMGSPKVRSMTGIQRGIYISLLCHSWEEGAIPDDPGELWMRCGVTPDQMADAWPKVRKCFVEHPSRDGMLVNERVEREREAALQRVRNARQAGKKSGESRSESNGGSNGGSGGRSNGRSRTTRASDASDAQSTDVQEETDTQPPRANGGAGDVAERDWAVVLTKLRDRRSKVLDQLSDDGSFALEQIGGMDTLTGSRVDDVRHIRRDFMDVHPRAS